MNIKNLFAIVIFTSIPIAACGDHIVLTADKTGDCVKGLLTKCNGDCVDLQTSLAHCGACGKACNVNGGEICSNGKCTAQCPMGSMRCNDKCIDTNVDRLNCGVCGKTCAMNEICAKGMCAASCEAAGYATCIGASTMVDAGGAKNCVDLRTENSNCGSCGNVCSGMFSCSNGACCLSGQIGCNKTCVNPQSDANNCGGCGIVCPMAAPNCVSGACSKCKPDILILADGQTVANTNMSNAFKTAGFRPTVVDSGAQQYAGMVPKATDFSAIVVTPGSGSMTDMPTAGQQAIVSAQAAGVGVVLDGLTPYSALNGRFQTLKSLALLAGGSNNTYSGGPVEYTDINIIHPWFDGAAITFSPVNQTLIFWDTSIINGGTEVATLWSNPYPAVELYRAMPNGRIVQFGYGINFGPGASQWTNDSNMTQWTISGVRYAAGCSM